MKEPTLHLYLDSADDSILPLLRLPVVYGVTTNPTLQREAGLSEAELEGFVEKVLEEGARAVQVQVKHQDSGGMVADAKRFAGWSPEPGRVVPKIPVTREGLQAVGQLSEEGVRCTLTAIYRPEQILWSLMAGARYAAPYLGRIGDAGEDGLAAIGRMQELLRNYVGEARDFRLLVASVRTREDFLALASLGVGAITIRPSLFTELLENDATLQAERAFLADAEALSRV